MTTDYTRLLIMSISTWFKIAKFAQWFKARLLSHYAWFSLSSGSLASKGLKYPKACNQQIRISKL